MTLRDSPAELSPRSAKTWYANNYHYLLTISDNNATLTLNDSNFILFYFFISIDQKQRNQFRKHLKQ